MSAAGGPEPASSAAGPPPEPGPEGSAGATPGAAQSAQGSLPGAESGAAAAAELGTPQAAPGGEQPKQGPESQAAQQGAGTAAGSTAEGGRGQEARGGEEPGGSSEREPLLTPAAPAPAPAPAAAAAPSPSSGWGWGSWTSVVSAIQEVAVEAQKTATAAAKGVVEQLEAEAREMEERQKQQQGEEESTEAQPAASAQRDGAGQPGGPAAEGAAEGQGRSATGGQLERANEDSMLGQGLKTLDDSMESIASGALHALGNAWKGGLTLMQTLEHSAGALTQSSAEGTQSAGTTVGATTLLQSGRGLAAQGLRVLELVSKETIDILVQETGIELEKDEQVVEEREAEPADEEMAEEEVTFDHCFYIYGGPDYLEELEALSDHHALVCSRARAKLPAEERAALDALLPAVKALLAAELPGEAEAGQAGASPPQADVGEEVRAMRDSSLRTSMEVASGFSARLSGLPAKEMAGRTAERLETIKAEGVHRVSELCAVCISRLLEVGKELLAASGGGEEKGGSQAREGEGEAEAEAEREERSCLERARSVRGLAQVMAADIHAVVDSFVTGMNEVVAAFTTAAGKGEGSPPEEDGEGGLGEGAEAAALRTQQAVLQTELQADGGKAVGRLQEGLLHLAHVLLSTRVKTSATPDSSSQP